MRADAREGSVDDAYVADAEADASARAVSTSRSAREALTMALYVCLVLSAELVAMAEEVHSERLALSIIWGTTVGLSLAHVFAFNLSARLFGGGRVPPQEQADMLSQLLASGIVAVTLSLPFVFLSLSRAINFDQYLTAGFLTVIGYGVARGAGRSQARAVAFGLVMLAFSLVVIGIKVALGH